MGRTLRPPRVRNGVHPRLGDQRLPLLPAASPGFVEARGPELDRLASLEGRRLRSFSPEEQAALNFAEKLTRDSANISDADIEALKPHFSDEQILDLDMLVGLVNLTNRLTDPLGADLEFPAEKI